MSDKNYRGRSNQFTGTKGESFATNWLKNQGYFIKDRNWRHGRLEIDIIAQKNGTFHFVEVKTVTSERYGLGEEKINKEKIKRMLLAASHYLRLSHWHGSFQFDVLAILIDAGGPEYCLFEDVWP
ncbi:YraN family protein [Arachidicoccus terrestris]|uniref:YraN family protein n=1 Tax=Arachidicoccus terrestris TaxID=2875539 RepID=UPI001CC813A4|nr:YraN family protein [Arachidicoccus terrestris]UAY55678.1 YraN family protein [Arachidicoccus terrestris]